MLKENEITLIEYIILYDILYIDTLKYYKIPYSLITFYFYLYFLLW